MDISALAAVRQERWDRLLLLAKARRLTGEEVDELSELYQQCSTDLALVSSLAPDSAVAHRLSAIVHRARTRLTAAPQGMFRGLGQFFVVTLPAAMYALRWVVLGVTVGFLLVTVLTAWWVAANPDVQDALAPEPVRRALASRDFVAYYSENPAGIFALGVWTNNAWIALQLVALGITGFWPVYVLLINAFNIGVTAGILVAYGEAGTFFTYILPHGIPEIASILLAGAAGLRIFWAWVAPGPMTRGAALGKQGRSLITVGLGLVLILAVSAVIESLVTPAEALPIPVRVGTGVLFTAAVIAYVWYFGKAAAKAGLTGDLGRRDGGELVDAVD